ncbi:hypothetical protein LCGC14_2198860 [marine sediment metagenome]|uniref:Uncharacterized protein n=1 Tax=marine sediment metagenome TaxID=412755 RepID=A0A0F9DHA6_9ZZZZ
MSKIKSINSDMDEFHNLNNSLYESLMDDEDKDTIKICNTLIRKYRDIKASIQSNKIK